MHLHISFLPAFNLRTALWWRLSLWGISEFLKTDSIPYALAWSLCCWLGWVITFCPTIVLCIIPWISGEELQTLPFPMSHHGPQTQWPSLARDWVRAGWYYAGPYCYFSSALGISSHRGPSQYFQLFYILLGLLTLPQICFPIFCPSSPRIILLSLSYVINLALAFEKANSRSLVLELKLNVWIEGLLLWLMQLYAEFSFFRSPQ